MKQRLFVALLFPVLMVVIAYAPIYNGPFIWDDEFFLVRWNLLQQSDKYSQILAGALPDGHEGGYRPLRTLYETVLAQLFGANPSPYHILAVFFHSLTTITVFFIVLKLFEVFYGKEIRHRLLLACFGATMFGLHPVMQSSVAFIQASFDTLGITVALLAYYCSIVALKVYLHKKFSRTFWFSVGIYALLSLIAYSFFELSYTLPIIIFLTSFLVLAQKATIKKSLSIAGMVSVPSLILLGCVLFLRIFILELPTGRVTQSPGMWFTFLVSTRAIFLYIFQTIFPVHLAAIHEVALGITTAGSDSFQFASLRITDLKSIIPLGVMIAVFIFCYKNYKKYPLEVFGYLWFFIGLFPVLNIVVYATIYSERYLYFSLVGFVLVILSLVHRHIDRIKKDYLQRTVVLLLIISIASVYGIRTFIRVTEWTNPIYFWKKEVSHLPHVAPIRTYLAVAYSLAGNQTDAVTEFKKTVELDPTSADTHFNLSFALSKMNQFKEALVYAEQAVALNPNKMKYLVHLQQLYQQLQDSKRSMKFFSELSQSGKASAEIHYVYGNIALREGQTATAEASLRRAIELDPTLEGAYINLGALLNSLKRPEDAIEILESLRSTGNQNADLLYNLAVSYKIMGDTEKATIIINQAITVRPSDPHIQKLREELSD